MGRARRHHLGAGTQRSSPQRGITAVLCRTARRGERRQDVGYLECAVTLFLLTLTAVTGWLWQARPVARQQQHAVSTPWQPKVRMTCAIPSLCTTGPRNTFRNLNTLGALALILILANSFTLIEHSRD